MKRLAVFLACAALVPGLAAAQSPSQPNYPTNVAQGSVKSVPGQVCMFYNPSLGYAVPCSTDNPLPIAPTASDASSTNASGTVTTGNTYQTVFASSTTRKGCTIQNPTTATEVLLVRTAGAIIWYVGVGNTFSCNTPGLVIDDLVEVTAATTAHAFTAASQ